MQRGRVMSGEWKTFRNYFLKHNSSVSCFMDLELPWEPLGVSEPLGGARPRRHYVGSQSAGAAAAHCPGAGNSCPQGQARCRGRPAERQGGLKGLATPALAEASRVSQGS